MKTKGILTLIILAFVFFACEKASESSPSLPNEPIIENIVGKWFLKAYTVFNDASHQKPIPQNGEQSLTFGIVKNDTCTISLNYVNVLQTSCVFGTGNEMSILDEWGGTEIFDTSGNEEELLNALNNVEKGILRNDTLFLLLNSHVAQDYNAICLKK